MALYDISITKGQTASLQFTVENIPDDDTVQSATLTVKEDEDSTSALFTKTITSTPGADGFITDPTAGGTALLTFLLSASNSNSLVSTKPYCVYSVTFTTTEGASGVSIPVGAIYARTKV